MDVLSCRSCPQDRIRPSRTRIAPCEHAAVSKSVLTGRILFHSVGTEEALSQGQYGGTNTHLIWLAEGNNSAEDKHTSIGTVTISRKEITLRHLPQVVFVQELATLALLAQPSQPMLTDQIIVIRVSCSMPVWTRRALRAMTL